MDLTDLRPGFGTWMPGVAMDARGRVWGLWHPGGCRVSEDQGATWTACPLGRQGASTALALGPDDTVFVGTAHGEVFESRTRGMTWTRHTLPGLKQVQWILATPRGVLVSGARMYRRPVDDMAWLTGAPRPPTVTAVAASETGVLYAGFRQGRRAWLARSDDCGAQWTEVHELKGYRRVVTALAATGDTVYAAVGDPRTWGGASCEGLRSTDRGARWVPFMVPCDPRQWIASLWAAGPVVYGVTTGFNLDDAGPGQDAMLMRSTDGCRTWDVEVCPCERTYAAAGDAHGTVWFTHDGGGVLRVHDPEAVPHRSTHPGPL